MSIVIVEGVDGAGKTTLLRDLRAQVSRYFWVASSSQRPKTLPDLQNAIHWIGQASYLKLPVICDRFPLISEAVYGPVLRGASLLDQFTRKEQQTATDLIQQIDRIIYCRPPIERILRNLHENKAPQLEGVFQKLEKLLKAYDDLMDSLRDDNVLVYQYDYTRNYTHSLETLFFGKI